MLSRRSFQILATIAWRIAAMQTASSTRVQTSQTRNSSVGIGVVRPHVPPDLRAVGHAAGRTSESSSVARTFRHDRRIGGTPVRGKFLNTMLRYDLSPVTPPHARTASWSTA